MLSRYHLSQIFIHVTQKHRHPAALSFSEFTRAYRLVAFCAVRGGKGKYNMLHESLKDHSEVPDCVCVKWLLQRMYNSPMRAKSKLRAMSPFNLQFLQMWKRDRSPQNYLQAPDRVHRTAGGDTRFGEDYDSEDAEGSMDGRGGGEEDEGEQDFERFLAEQLEIVVERPPEAAPVATPSKRPIFMQQEHAHSSHSHQMTSSLRDEHEFQKQQQRQERQQQMARDGNGARGNAREAAMKSLQQQREAMAKLHKGENETGHAAKHRAQARLKKQQQHDGDSALHAQHVMSKTRQLLQKKKGPMQQPAESGLLRQLREEKVKLESAGAPIYGTPSLPAVEVQKVLPPPPPVEVVPVLSPPPPPPPPPPPIPEKSRVSTRRD
jgi:hypothetical protein